MTFTFEEQPPDGESPELKEWLARLSREISISANTPNGFGGGVDNNPHLFMRWAGEWIDGEYYRKGDVVRDDGFTMICKGDTFDKAAPVPDGAPSWSMPDIPVWNTEQENVDDIKGGHIYTLSQNGWIQEARAWGPVVNPNVDYRTVFVTDAGRLVIEIPVLEPDEWTPLSFTQQLLFEGQTLEAILETIDSAGQTTYVELVGRWPGGNPSWASSVEGELAFDDVDQPLHENEGYGIDVLFQPAAISPNWEVVSFS